MQKYLAFFPFCPFYCLNNIVLILYITFNPLVHSFQYRTFHRDFNTNFGMDFQKENPMSVATMSQ